MTCSVSDCPRKPRARGYCEKHYRRWRKYGDPLKTFRARGEGKGSAMGEPLAIGLTYRQLDYWTRRGYLKAEDPTPGSGHSRTWLEDEQVIAARMLRLISCGFTVEAAARIARDETDLHIVGGNLEEAS